MKTNHSRKHTRSAFTLIEMIGVLAVIAILAALLIPKVFAAINSAKISNTSTSLNTIKTAAIDHYAKFGTLAVDGSTPSPTPLDLTDDPNPGNLYDKILLKEGFIDKLFQVKIGDGIIGNPVNTRIQLVPAVNLDTEDPPAPIAPTGSNSAYNLDGDDDTGVNNAVGSYVLEAVITGVALADARDLNRVIDGTSPELGEDGGSDLAGRVKYADPGTGLATVHVYLTHR